MIEDLERQVHRLQARIDWMEYMALAQIYELGIHRRILEVGEVDPEISEAAAVFLRAVAASCDELVAGDDELSRKAGELLGE